MTIKRTSLYVSVFLLMCVFTLPALAESRRGKGHGSFKGPFQVAFVSRITSNILDEVRFVEITEGDAESLQIPVPGVIIGQYVEEIDFNTITEPPGAPATDLEIATRGTLTTRFGSLSWEATLLIVFLDIGDPDGIEAATITQRGAITGGTGIYKRATGTIEIAGYLEGCNLGEDYCSPSWSVTPDLPDRGRRFDFNYILRGEFK
jgi:hypothetical protein